MRSREEVLIWALRRVARDLCEVAVAQHFDLERLVQVLKSEYEKSRVRHFRRVSRLFLWKL